MNVWLLVPPGIGPFPAIVACHQTVAEGKDEPVGLGGHHYQLNYGPFLASRGFVVIAADSPGAGERLAPGDVPYDTSRMEARDPAWSMLGQRLHDHMRCIDYLQTLPFVDPARIGAIGHSLGGESTALLTAMDERIQAAVISCPFTLLRTLDNAADIYTAKGSMILPASFRKHLEVPVPRRRLPFDFDDCMALWPPRPVFFHGVKDDLWANAPQVAQALQAVEAVYRLHNAADRLAYHWSAQTHCFPEWVQRDAFDALDYWLKRSDRPGSTR
jgi:dienelactone hydrolase